MVLTWCVCYQSINIIHIRLNSCSSSDRSDGDRYGKFAHMTSLGRIHFYISDGWMELKKFLNASVTLVTCSNWGLSQVDQQDDQCV